MRPFFLFGFLRGSIVLDVGFDSNLSDILQNLRVIEKDQVPFALASTLTSVAHEGRQAIQDDMPDKFTLRSNWTKRGIRVKAAKKTDLHAQVYTMDWYMESQETGGIRRPKQGRHLWIPTLDARVDGSFAGKLQPKYKPKNLSKKIEAAKEKGRKRKKPGKGRYASLKPFIVENSDSAGVFIRRSNERLPIIKLFSLVDKAKIPARWGFDARLQNISDKRLRYVFVKSMDRALKSAKTGPVKSSYIEYLMEHDGVSGAVRFPAATGESIPSAPSFADTLAVNGR